MAKKKKPLNKKIFAPVLWFLAIFVAYWIIVSVNPTQAEVERYLEKNKCYTYEIEADFYDEYLCARNLRRHSTKFLGQVYRAYVPFSFVLTPFWYYNYIDPVSQEDNTYVYVVIRGGKVLVYNPVNGEYIKSFDDFDEMSRDNRERHERLLNSLRGRSNEEYVCTSNYYDCSHFSTQSEAQKVYDACGADDIHFLDGDDDGVACETLF
jgi:hypothetical protein